MGAEIGTRGIWIARNRPTPRPRSEMPDGREIGATPKFSVRRLPGKLPGGFIPLFDYTFAAMPPKKSAVSSVMAQAGPTEPATTMTDGTTSGNPDVSPPSNPIERMDDSILVPSEPDASTMELDAPSSDTVQPTDTPGPSSTYIPRQPSPPLPHLRSEKFPPEWDDGDGDSDSDDEVVATLPIYLSPSLHPHLHLFQFPLHTRSLVAPSYARDRGKGITARMKEKAGRIEVEIPVDAGVDVWRDDRARDFGMTHDLGNGNGDVVGGYGFGGRGEEDAGGKKKKSKAKEEKRWGDKIRLRSEGVPSTTGYYAGVVQDGELAR